MTTTAVPERKITMPQRTAKSNVQEPEAILLRSLETVTPEDVQWLWSKRIPLGKLTLLGGDPNVGKSYLSIAIAASVTTGTRLPGDDRAFPLAPASVLILAYEDGLADTIKPRAEKCQANHSRVLAPEQADLLSAAQLDATLLANPDVRLVVIDPVNQVIRGSANTNEDVRNSLRPYLEVAEHRRVALLGVLHLRKQETAKAIHRIGGSLAGLVGLARSVIVCGPTNDRKAVMCVKHNLASSSPAIEFTIDDDGFKWGAQNEEIDENTLVGNIVPASRSPQREKAIAFLREALANGPRAVKDLKAEAEAEGIHEKALDRAAGKIGIIRTPQTGLQSAGWTWALPATVTVGSEP